MKKWFLIISSILLIVIIGSFGITLHGHNERSYQASLQHGRFNVIDRNYRDALNYFQGAKKVNPNGDQAGRDLSETQSYVSGNHYFYRRRLNLAAKNYRRAVKISAISALNRRSLERYKAVNGLRSSSVKFIRGYEQALVLNHQGKYKASARRLDRIKSLPELDSRYFHEFRIKANRLLTADHKEARSHQVSAFGSKSSRVAAFKLRAPRVLVDHPSRVTIAKARREIKRAGVNSREMSNGDVANVIRQARRHRSSVEKYAKKNY